MNTSFRRTLWVLTVLSLGGSVAVVNFCVSPIEVPSPERRAPLPAQGTLVTKMRGSQLPAPEELQKFAASPLRREIFDPPPRPAEPPPKLEPPPSLRVLGTVIGPSVARAMIAGPQGRVEFKRVGDRIGEGEHAPRVVVIEKAQVVVEYRGERLELAVEKGR